MHSLQLFVVITLDLNSHVGYNTNSYLESTGIMHLTDIQCTIMDWPIKTLEFYYLMIHQFSTIITINVFYLYIQVEYL